MMRVFELIRSLTRQGKTIAMVVHDLGAACRYADHLIAMRDGRILREGAPSDVVTTELIEELYGVTCDLIKDPSSGSPVLINLRRLDS